MLTYNTFIASLANMIVVPVNDPAFVIALPNIIDDAEQRLYRELDMLATFRSDETGTLAANGQGFSIPTPSGGNGPFVVIDLVNVITPAGLKVATGGTRNPLTPTSKEFVIATYPGPAGAAVPKFYAMTNPAFFLVGPWSDAAYYVEVVGTIRPAPLSVSNQTTLLSTYLPDVFLAAALVMSAGYQLNFSAMGDNPQSGVTWESHVKTLLDSAKVEEFRKKFGSEGWTSKEPDPMATPPRT